jgi:hypothetical protein
MIAQFTYCRSIWSDDAHDDTIKLFYKIIFDNQLQGWWTDEKDWPLKRDFTMFKEWFDIELHSIVQDLVDAPLEDDNLDH